MSTITYSQLRTFLAVVRAGSLTRAARELHASQPTVSLQLLALRRALETDLVERSDQGLRLTPAGEKVRRYAEQALGGLRTLEQDIAAFEGSLTGSVAVGATFVISRYVLPATLSRFRAACPGVDVELHVEQPGGLLDGLLAGSLDVGCFIAVPVATPAGLTVEKLGVEEFVIIASPRHPLAGRRRVLPEELSPHPFVAPVSLPLRTLIETKLRAAAVTPRAAAEGRHHDAIKQLVGSNAGYSMLIGPAVADELADGRLVALRLDGPPIEADIVVTYRVRSRMSPLVRRFVEFVRADLQRGGRGRRSRRRRVERRRPAKADPERRAPRAGRPVGPG